MQFVPTLAFYTSEGRLYEFFAKTTIEVVARENIFLYLAISLNCH